MLGFLTVRRARRAAVETVGPWVDVSRAQLGPLPDHFWRSPYIRGYMATLISTAALAKVKTGLDSDRLGLVQLDAWVKITSQPPDCIGQEITYLSLTKEPQFQRGVHNAHRFFNVFEGGELTNEDINALFGGEAEDEAENNLQRLELSPTQLASFGATGTIAASLWRRLFERRLLSF